MRHACTYTGYRVITNNMGSIILLCYRTYSAMVDDKEALSIIHECRELEERYNTTQILNVNNPTESAD